MLEKPKTKYQTFWNRINDVDFLDQLDEVENEISISFHNGEITDYEYDKLFDEILKKQHYLNAESEWKNNWVNPSVYEFYK